MANALDLFRNSLRRFIDNPSYEDYDNAINALQLLKSQKDLPPELNPEIISNAESYLQDNIRANLEVYIDYVNAEERPPLRDELFNEMREDALWLQSNFPWIHQT